MVYREELLNEFFNPYNVGVIKGANGVGKVVTEEGEIFKIFISVNKNVIENATFQTFGCSASIAATSVATRLIIGKTLEEAAKITYKEILKELGGQMPQGKEDSPLMAEQAIKKAIKSIGKKGKKGKNQDSDEDDE